MSSGYLLPVKFMLNLRMLLVLIRLREKSQKYFNTYGQKSFAYRGATVWNSLDHQIKLSPSLSNFKFKLKEEL